MEDYELAFEFYNTCRSNGIQGANTDFLILPCIQVRDFNLKRSHLNTTRLIIFVGWVSRLVRIFASNHQNFLTIQKSTHRPHLQI
ncbi:hypothetical protein [Nostoc sp. CHAB 5715]|uniref:hypothetical protein n=1 Tax=Nostoc sp. CHAB 5715 TaxID=2780400 RepID=UPI001E54FE6F|nr:hypothetical protein [Nostoc sp. CHAB 5715]MCC5623421.1 hypothetical protein [Nostoc sp. CHAB 5715]